MMCRSTHMLGLILCTLGLGFLLSCLFASWLIRLLLGAACIVVGLLVSKEGT